MIVRVTVMKLRFSSWLSHPMCLPHPQIIQNAERGSAFYLAGTTEHIIKKKSGSDCPTHYDECPCFSFTYDIVLQYDEQRSDK
ncbi:Uncharacterized protein APZ42_005976 [Daphnia magna]|uniref:Uncharacterized protein n=1 Tax=Daphnia magna TaxID=35525 RepID=A0A164G5D3_9CRUS|nr:Uncharacterized protein APZ42_005976 [Daphnia magna]